MSIVSAIWLIDDPTLIKRWGFPSAHVYIVVNDTGTHWLATTGNLHHSIKLGTSIKISNWINLECRQPETWSDVRQMLVEGKLGKPTWGTAPKELYNFKLIKNNDGRKDCYWCGNKTKKVMGFSSYYDICGRCNK